MYFSGPKLFGLVTVYSFMDINFTINFKTNIKLLDNNRAIQYRTVSTWDLGR